MRQAEAVEATTLVVMDEFRLVPVSTVYWKTKIRDFTVEDIENMAASLRVHGQIEPIIVKPEDASGLHEGVCGYLRFEGAVHAKLAEVLVRIHRFTDEDEVGEWRLAENLHRKELSALERAEAYAELAELRKKSFSEESILQGISMSIEALTGNKPGVESVKKYLKVSCKLGKKAKDMCTRVPPNKDFNLGIKHLEQISRVADEDVQATLAEKAIAESWTVQRLKREVDNALGISKPKPGPKPGACQTIMCQTCRASLILVHDSEGKHGLLVNQRRPAA